MSEELRYLLQLLDCAMHQTHGEPLPSTLDWEEVQRLVKNNHLEAIAFEGAALEDQASLRFQPWKEEHQHTLFRSLHFRKEREKLLADLHEAHIATLCLKGILLENDYPKIGLRFMADNDILYGFLKEDEDGLCAYDQQEAQKLLCTMMKHAGYEIHTLSGAHDSFIKPPFYHFEMHRLLFVKTSPFYTYYANPWKRAKKVDDLTYVFSKEDEYLYLLAHSFKHEQTSGFGFRFILDLYAFYQHNPNLDWAYLHQELQVLQLVEYEEKMRTLTLHLFEQHHCSEEEEAKIAYFFGCGTYGTAQMRVQKALLQKIQQQKKPLYKAKWHYFWNRVLLSKEDCKEAFPFFYAHPNLRFLLFGPRLVDAWTKRRAYLFAEVKTLFQIKDDGL